MEHKLVITFTDEFDLANICRKVANDIENGINSGGIELPKLKNWYID